MYQSYSYTMSSTCQEDFNVKFYSWAAQAENESRNDLITNEPCFTIEDQPICEVSML